MNQTDWWVIRTLVIGICIAALPGMGVVVTGRFIWITEADLAAPLDSTFREIMRERFRAAPQDAVAQIAQVMLDAAGPGASSQEYRAAIELADHMAHAIGMP